MKTTTTLTALLILLLMGFLSFGYPATVAAQVTTVALSGTMAPGTTDTFATGFGGPVLNDAGQIAFIGGLNTSYATSSGIWSEGGGSGLALVARKGTGSAPGTTDTFGNFLFAPVLNDAGQTAFRGILNSSFATDGGIWSEGGGSGLALVAREGIGTAPGTTVTFDFLSSTPVFNDAGQTAFWGRLNGSSATNEGIWSEGGGSGLALVARAGTGSAPGTTDTFVAFDSPVLNDAGQTAFTGLLNGSVVTREGIWSEGGGGGLALVARRRTGSAPGTTDDFSGLFFGPNETIPVLNDAGQIAFFGRLNGSNATNAGIWSEGGGSGLALVARKGTGSAPGTTDTFSVFNNPVLNDAGQIAFIGRLNGSVVTREGIWSEGGGSGLALVARTGTGLAPGTTNTFVAFNSPVLNDAGQTAFWGRLNGNSANSGIWAEDLSGILTLIARVGDRLDVDDGPGTDFRTISSLRFLDNTGNGDGRPSGFNNLGQLAFQARFTDTSSGIFLSNLVAQPSTSADFDSDGDVDGADFLAWQRGLSTNPLSATDLALWESQYGAAAVSAASATVPEPSTLLLGALASAGLWVRRRRVS